MKFYWFTLLLFSAAVAKCQDPTKLQHPASRQRRVNQQPAQNQEALQNQAPPNDCKDRETIKNRFGETVESYTSKTVVYVYDFYQDGGQGKFYKITKRGNDLDPKPIDLNSETLKPGADVYLKVVNINRLMYDISINPGPTATKERQPEILQGRDLFGDTMILNTWMYGIVNVNDPDVENLVAEAGLNGLFRAFSAFIVEYARLDQRIVEAYSPCNFPPCCEEVDIPSLTGLIAKELKIKARAVKFLVLSDKVKGLLTATNASIDGCNSIQKKLDSLATLAKISPLKKDQESLLKDLSNKKCPDADVTAYKNKKTKLTSMLASINSVVALLSRLPTEGDLRKMIIFLENYVKSNQETLIRLEVGPNGLDINLNIRGRDSVLIPLSLPHKDPVVFHQFIPVVGKAQLSFSIGTFGGFPKYLGNTTYAWQQLSNNVNTVQPGANYILVESGYTQPALGFAAMANLEWKICRSFGLGPSGGVALTVEQNARLVALAGGSLFLGNWRQVVISGGFAGMAINRLTNNWQTVADKEVIYTTQPALSYYKELRVGAFVSVTFTPFKLWSKN